ncbi:MAG: O-antigen ligase family protein [Candidatus Portnoybacteria bacterium]|nr:O-antigen ligase family protein [Candidatus Portnoybacteria bacterium]
MNWGKIEKWLFYILVFLIPFQAKAVLYSFRADFNEWTSIFLYLTDIFVLALLALWLPRIFKQKGGKRPDSEKKPAGTILAIFLIIAAISLFFTENLRLGFYEFVKLLEFAALFLYVRYNFSRFYNLEKLWQVFIASALLQSIVAIIQFFIQKSIGLKFFESPLGPDIAGVAKLVIDEENIIRAYGLTPHPNILAIILILAIFGLALLFIRQYGGLSLRRKIIFGAIFILISWALFLTFSRVAIIVGLISFILWLALLYRMGHERKAVIIVFTSLFIVFCLLTIIYQTYIFNRFDPGSITEGQDYQLRVLYNKIALDFIKGHPIFGVGHGNFVWTISSYSFMKPWMWQPVHNIYLLIAAEIGVVGLLVFLWFLYLIIEGFFKRKNRNNFDKLSVYCLLFVIFTLLIVGLFDHLLWDIQTGQIILWLFLGILASYSFSGIAKKSL